MSLQQVLAQVWPSAFYTEPDGAQVLDTSLLVSATEVSSRPQTVVYQINPRAVWSDGTPLTYADFVYNWEAQSGQARFTDVGGRPFTPVDEAGYDDIADVSGSAADPYTATVTFSSPYPDWRSLFSYLMPAHVAQAIGFGSGFTDPVADLVSAGPYLVSQLHPGYSLELVRNAGYWGTPGNLALITYYFTSTLTETLNALSGHELDVATVPAEPGHLPAIAGRGPALGAGGGERQLRGPGFQRVVAPGLQPGTAPGHHDGPGPYDHGRRCAGPLRRAGLRPVENRLYLPGESGYKADGTAYDKPAPAAALALLSAHGYTFSNGALHLPDGQPVDLSLFVPSADPVAQQLGGPDRRLVRRHRGDRDLGPGWSGRPALTGPARAWAGRVWAASARSGRATPARLADGPRAPPGAG